MRKSLVLVVDDEWNMRNLLRVYLTKGNFDVIEAKDGHEALSTIQHQNIDLIILDIMMPGMDGWEVCAHIRQTSRTPILMLTARTETKDKVQGLTMGADDYLVKPFEPEEMMARVKALLRRSEGTSSNSTILTIQDMKIDPEKRKAYIHDQPFELTPKEFDLLCVLINHPGRVFSREVLLDQIWGNDYFGDLRTVDTHVKNVREKVRKAGLTYSPIQTVWGVGYKSKDLEERK
ncbi:DNA-binding response regulator [Salipaludibacillus neizhouensis]|uniref:DNA-binding response regulator n=1 Tax=Salipaludibacillus neizhouensis TaxID=885475 RepID=A0A3A9KF00_9BACI|nr:response regulator transcription factor [Salipaludibacillus neizhouensis]RKL69230.1 DNA-binding response regulator [Salipaludibacillus neizhouensis]